MDQYLFFFFFSSRRRHTRSLCDWSSDVCSSDLSAYLTEAVRHELDRSLAHVRVLRELTVILSDAGVNALAFKGPVLSLRLYGDAATRISADLDIVVARRDYSLARSTLLAAGFSPHNEHSAWREEHLFRWLGHASFHRNGTDVELHWRVLPIQFSLPLTPGTP